MSDMLQDEDLVDKIFIYSLLGLIDFIQREELVSDFEDDIYSLQFQVSCF